MKNVLYFDSLEAVANYFGMDSDELETIKTAIAWNGETPLYNYYLSMIYIEDNDYMAGRVYRVAEV